MKYVLLFPRLYNPNFGLSVGHKKKEKGKKNQKKKTWEIWEPPRCQAVCAQAHGGWR